MTMTLKKGLALSANKNLLNLLATSYENKADSTCLSLKSLSGGVTGRKAHTDAQTHTHTHTHTHTRTKCEDHILQISFQNFAGQIHDFYLSTSYTWIIYYS